MTETHREAPISESSAARARVEQREGEKALFAEIKRKIDEGEELTSAELRVLYGVDREPDYDEYLLESLRERRNPEQDMPRVFGCEPEQIARTPGEIDEHTVAYVGQLVYEGVFRQIPPELKYIYADFPKGRVTIERVKPEPNVRAELALLCDTERAFMCAVNPPTRAFLRSGRFAEEADAEEVRLVRLSLADLGFRGGADWSAIYRRARILGLEPCPPGAALTYWKNEMGSKQPDTLFVGMEPVAEGPDLDRALIFELRRELSDDLRQQRTRLHTTHVEYDGYLNVYGDIGKYEFLFAQSDRGPLTEEEILALPEEDAQELFALPGYLPSHAVIRKAFGVTEFVPSEDQDVLDRDELGLSRSDMDKVDRWVNYCWDGILPESGISASTYEFWNEEHLAALADHIADTARSIGTQGTEQVTVLEVGAGNGRLSHFLRNKLKTRCGDTVRVIGVDNGSWKLRPFFPVERCEHEEALAEYKPAIVLFSWMPRDVDITPDICAIPSVQEVLLIGETEGGCCGGPWASEAGIALNDEKVSYAKRGFTRIDLDDLSAKQVCRTDLPGHFMHSRTVSLRRTT